MHHSSFSTSKSKAPITLAVVATLLGTGAVLLLHAFTTPRLALVLAIAAWARVLFVLAARKRGVRDDPARIEPTFETSILAFPPEPKLGRRPLPRTWRPQ